MTKLRMCFNSRISHVCESCNQAFSFSSTRLVVATIVLLMIVFIPTLIAVASFSEVVYGASLLGYLISDYIFLKDLLAVIVYLGIVGVGRVSAA